MKYCDIYSKDLSLSERLGLNEAHLSNAVSFPALFNPLFWNKKLLVDSGLMHDRGARNTRQQKGDCLTEWCASKTEGVHQPVNAQQVKMALTATMMIMTLRLTKIMRWLIKNENILKPTKPRSIAHVWKSKQQERWTKAIARYWLVRLRVNVMTCGPVKILQVTLMNVGTWTCCVFLRTTAMCFRLCGSYHSAACQIKLLK